MAAISGVKVLKQYFESGDAGRSLGMDEMKALTKEEREELADLAATAMGLKKNEEGKYE